MKRDGYAIIYFINFRNSLFYITGVCAINWDQISYIIFCYFIGFKKLTKFSCKTFLLVVTVFLLSRVKRRFKRRHNRLLSTVWLVSQSNWMAVCWLVLHIVISLDGCLGDPWLLFELARRRGLRRILCWRDRWGLEC